MDKATMLPLPYTSLAIRNASLGTIANEAGEFRITIPGKLIKDTLVISYVGYAKQVYPISTLASKVPLNIFLVQETTQLSEVVVRDTRLDANEIMEKAVGAIKKNYPTAAFMMEGFFREIIQEDMQYVDLTESAIRVYDKSFQRRLNRGITEEVSITEGRRSINYANPIVQRVRKQNSIMDLLDNNPVHYTRGLLNTKYFDYKIDSILQSENELIYIISTIPGRHYIYVADGSYAIIKTIEEISETDTLRRPEFNLNDSLIVRRMIYFKAITEFQRFKDKMYLKYSNETDAYEILHRSTRKRKFLIESYKEFVVTNLVHENPLPFAKKEKYNFRDDIVSKDYNSTFWKNNMIFQLSPLSLAIRKDLEKEMPLSDQFSKKQSEH
jgi:hypothetical protein